MLDRLAIKNGSKHSRRRIGRGIGSGMGKTSTRGTKGAGARTGYKAKAWSEGGQMPLIRRLPKRGFNNAAFRKNYAVVNLEDLNSFDAGTVINEETLRESKLIRGNVAGLKILGGGELKHALSIEAHKVSASAREKIEKAGGTVTLRDMRRPEGPHHPGAA